MDALGIADASVVADIGKEINEAMKAIETENEDLKDVLPKTYNRLDKLKVTLERLLDSPAEDLAALVVVDNASDDGTGAWLRDWAAGQPRADVLHSEINRGGAGGFALGMARAMEQHAPDWLVVMDDDARPAPAALAAFQAMGARGDLAEWDALAAAVYFPAGGICEMNRPSRNPFWSFGHFLATARKGRDGFHIPHSAYDAAEPCAIDVTSFVGFFISAAAVRRSRHRSSRRSSTGFSCSAT